MPTKSDIPGRDVPPWDNPRVPLGAQVESTPEARNARSKPAGPSQRDRRRNVENTIEPALERPKERTSSATDREAPNEVKRATNSSSQAMPGHIATRYVQVDNNYHFPNNGAPAFTDNATKLTIVHENLEALVAALPDVAASVGSGWESVFDKLATIDLAL